jgi:hypothetical protein
MRPTLPAMIPGPGPHVVRPATRHGRMGRKWRLVRRPLAIGLAAGLAACGADAPAVWDDGVCDSPDVSLALPDDVRESSGVAASRTHPGIYWTHNDSGWSPHVFAIDSTGQVVGRVRVAGVTNRDWEDIEAAPCSPGSADPCLFIGDIGDNNERHPRIAVFRIPEPDPWNDTLSAEPTTVRGVYRDGPRDAEALYVTDQGIHIINKGRSHAIELFRIPPPYRHGSVTTLVPLQQIAPPPTSVSAQVTAAAASPDQRRVVLRTYGGLLFFQVSGDTLVPLGRPAGLVAPDQRQGEGVDFLHDDRFVLTSEAQGPDFPAGFAIVRCDPLRPLPETHPPTDTPVDVRVER